MTKLEQARAALDAHRAELARLNALTFGLETALRQEEHVVAERNKVTDWEREVSEEIGGEDVHMARTWPRSTPGVPRYYVAAGVRGKLLVAWDVWAYRGEHRASLVFGSCPIEVELAVFRRFNLRSPR